LESFGEGGWLKFRNLIEGRGFFVSEFFWCVVKSRIEGEGKAETERGPDYGVQGLSISGTLLDGSIYSISAAAGSRILN